MGSEPVQLCSCQKKRCLNTQLLRTSFPTVLNMVPVRKYISLGKNYRSASWSAIYLTWRRTGEDLGTVVKIQELGSLVLSA